MKTPKSKMLETGKSYNESSSGEEDGDAEWKAKIQSAAVDITSSSFSKPPNKKRSNSSKSKGHETDIHYDENDFEVSDGHSPKRKAPNLHKLKVQKLLYEYLDKNTVFTRKPTPILSDPYEENGGGVRLFRTAPPGIICKTDAVSAQKRRPKIFPGEEIREKSKEFKRRIRAAAVEGSVVSASAEAAHQKALAKLERRLSAASAAAKREEEWIKELKKIRGEKWLPSIAKQMQRDSQANGRGYQEKKSSNVKFFLSKGKRCVLLTP